jgi:hypothetical protein
MVSTRRPGRQRRSEPIELLVGKSVGVVMGGRLVPAIVIEDRGKVAGERLLRVSIQPSGSTVTTFEVVESSLMDSPGDESRPLTANELSKLRTQAV